MNRSLTRLLFGSSAARTFTQPLTTQKTRICAFKNHRKLLSLVLNEGLRELGWHSCANTRLTVIKLPSSFEKFGPYALEGTRNLTVVLPENLLSVGSRWSLIGVGGEKLQMPQQALTIEQNVFRNCTELKEVLFPPNCKMNRICTEAFAKSGLAAFTAPAGLKEL